MATWSDEQKQNNRYLYLLWTPTDKDHPKIAYKFVQKSLNSFRCWASMTVDASSVVKYPVKIYNHGILYTKNGGQKLMMGDSMSITKVKYDDPGWRYAKKVMSEGFRGFLCLTSFK